MADHGKSSPLLQPRRSGLSTSLQGGLESGTRTAGLDRGNHVRHQLLARLGVNGGRPTPPNDGRNRRRRSKSARLSTVTSHTSLLSTHSLQTAPGFFSYPSFNDLEGLGRGDRNRDSRNSSQDLGSVDFGNGGLPLTPHAGVGRPSAAAAVSAAEGERGDAMRAADAHSKDELSLTLEHDLDPASEEALQMAVGTSIAKSVFTLCNTTVGAGTLALPFFFSQTGLALGSGMLIAIAGFSCYSLHLLAACGRCEIALKQTEDGRPARSYLDVAYFAFKRSGRLIVTISMLLLTFGALVAYFVIIGSLLESAIVTFIEKGKGIVVEIPSPMPVNDAHWEAKVSVYYLLLAFRANPAHYLTRSLPFPLASFVHRYKFVAKAVGIPSWLIEAPFLSLIALVCPILPLGALKNMSALGFVSLVALCSVAFLIALVVQVRRCCLRVVSASTACPAGCPDCALSVFFWRIPWPPASLTHGLTQCLLRRLLPRPPLSFGSRSVVTFSLSRTALGPRTPGRLLSRTSTSSGQRSVYFKILCTVTFYANPLLTI